MEASPTPTATTIPNLLVRSPMSDGYKQGLHMVITLLAGVFTLPILLVLLKVYFWKVDGYDGELEGLGGKREA
ncbi:hypothetical protein EDC01DRAFT_779978 [Geopyxis carbonaria]|nr:hypothetical protein EDC01DRAFT_779978 [Geopyxis carbonaria]